MRAIRYHNHSILVFSGPKQISYMVGETPHKTLKGAKADIDGKTLEAMQDLGVNRRTAKV